MFNQYMNAYLARVLPLLMSHVVDTTFTQKHFRPKMQTFLCGFMFHLLDNRENAYENVFRSKTLSKVETSENTRNDTLKNAV